MLFRSSDKIFAKVWSRRVGEQLGTFTSLLLVNAAIQNYFFPNNKVNISNPQDPDWLKFKFGNVSLDPTSGMLQPVNFVRSIGEASTKPQKELYGKSRLAKMGEIGLKYVRGKLSPGYGTALEQLTRTDYRGNVLPYFSDKPASGKHKLSYLEYALSKSPLPIAEATSEIYNSAAENDGDRATTNHILDGILSGGLSGATGLKFKVGEKSEKFGKQKLEEQYPHLSNQGLSLPELGKRESIKVRIDESHPEGHMTEEEYNKFVPLQNKYEKEEYDKFYRTHKREIDELSNMKNIVEKNKRQDKLQNKISEIHTDAIKKAKRELKLKSNK